MADISLVNFTDVSDAALKEMRSGSEGLFKKLAFHSGAEAGVTAKAHEAANAAVAASKLTGADELKGVADKAFRSVFRAESDHLLADKGHIWNVVKSFFRKIFGSAADGAGEIVGYTRNKANEFVKAPPGRVAKTLAWVPNKIGSFAKGHPKLALFGLAAGGIYAGSRVVASREEAKNQANYEAQMQQVAAMQQQAAAPQNPYYGGVSAEEAAAMEAQMRNGGQQSGFVAAEQQRRAAAAATEQASKA